MAEYKIYTLDHDAHIAAPPRIIDCADDAEAIQKTRQLLDGKDLELWNGPRMVQKFPHNK